MKKKIIVHIGLMKTASTTIQRGLHENRARLQKAGWYVPKTGSIFPSNAAQHNIVWDVLETCGTQHDLRYSVSYGTLDDLVEEINQSKDKNILISSECFQNFQQRHIRKFVDELAPVAGEIIVILYLRSQASWFPSLWSEQVKLGMTSLPINEWVKTQRSSGYFSELIDRWASVLGERSIRVRILEKDQLEGHVFPDFLNTCGIAEVDRFGIPKSVNISPGPRTLEVIRFLAEKLGEAPRPPYRDGHITFQVAEIVRRFGKGKGWDEETFGFYSRDQYQEIMDLYEESNKTLARKYLGRDGLFSEPFVEKPVFSIEDFRGEELLDLMSFLAKELPEWQEHDGVTPDNEIGELARLRREITGMRATRGWRFLEKYRRIRDELLKR